MLRRGLSAEQISGKLKHINISDLKDAYVCREATSSAIYALPVGKLRKELTHYLRQGKATRKPQLGQVGRLNQVHDMISIHLRPPEVKKCEFSEHREGDGPDQRQGQSIGFRHPRRIERRLSNSADDERCNRHRCRGRLWCCVEPNAIDCTKEHGI